MKRAVAIIITILSAMLAYQYWGDPISLGWIVAAAGWIEKCFEG